MHLNKGHQKGKVSTKNPRCMHKYKTPLEFVQKEEKKNYSELEDL